jgi:hypothetical protein
MKRRNHIYEKSSITRGAFFTQSRMQLRWICPCHLINVLYFLRYKVACNKQITIHIGKKNQLILVAKLNTAFTCGARILRVIYSSCRRAQNSQDIIYRIHRLSVDNNYCQLPHIKSLYVHNWQWHVQAQPHTKQHTFSSGVNMILKCPSCVTCWCS